MNRVIIFAAGFTLVYLILVLVYFLRRSKSHEDELTKFLNTAKSQVEAHKQAASKDADYKVAQAMEVVKKVQQAAAVFETNAKKEYQQVIQDAQAQRREMLSETKAEIEELFEQAEVELEEYRQHRQQEIEKNLVRMVCAVTERVVERSLDENAHKDIIYQTLEEVKTKKSRAE